MEHSIEVKMIQFHGNKGKNQKGHGQLSSKIEKLKRRSVECVRKVWHFYIFDFTFIYFADKKFVRFGNFNNVNYLGAKVYTTVCFTDLDQASEILS